VSGRCNIFEEDVSSGILKVWRKVVAGMVLAVGFLEKFTSASNQTLSSVPGSETTGDVEKRTARSQPFAEGNIVNGGVKT